MKHILRYFLVPLLLLSSVATECIRRRCHRRCPTDCGEATCPENNCNPCKKECRTECRPACRTACREACPTECIESEEPGKDLFGCIKISEELALYEIKFWRHQFSEHAFFLYLMLTDDDCNKAACLKKEAKKLHERFEKFICR